MHCLCRHYRDYSGASTNARNKFQFDCYIEPDLLDITGKKSKPLYYILYQIMQPIPIFIDQYNYRMNGVNLADQLYAVFCT